MANSSNTLLGRFVLYDDSEAFNEIVRQYSGLVYGACLRVLRDEHKAADAVQETFYQLLKNASEITCSLPGWLHRVATNSAISQLRKDSSRVTREKKYSVEKPIESEKWEDLSPLVDEELDKLDEQTREILIRHYLQGQTTRHIGKEIGVSQATISRRLDSGINLLRNRLSNRGLLLAATALGGLLVENTVQAAPAIVMSELGKMAIAGGAVAAGAGTGTAAAGTTAGGILAGTSTKIVTAAAIAVISVGSAVTYHNVNKQPPPPPAPVTQSAPESQPEETKTASASNQSTVQPWYESTVYEQGQEVITPIKDEKETAEKPPEDDFEPWFESLPATPKPAAASGKTATTRSMEGGTGGMMGGGYYYYRYSVDGETKTATRSKTRTSSRSGRRRAVPAPRPDEDSDSSEEDSSD